MKNITNKMVFRSGKECLVEFNKMTEFYDGFCDDLERWFIELEDFVTELQKMDEEGQLDKKSQKLLVDAAVTTNKIFSVMEILRNPSSKRNSVSRFQSLRDIMVYGFKI